MRLRRAEEGASVENSLLSMAALVSVEGPGGRDCDSTQKAQAPSTKQTRQPFSETSLPSNPARVRKQERGGGTYCEGLSPETTPSEASHRRGFTKRGARFNSRR